jgi:hypothetical protein
MTTTMAQQHERPRMTPAARPSKVSHLVAVLLVVGLAGEQLAAAWHFNYGQPESAAANQQLNLAPKPFGGVNPNNFYQPPANQFVAGQQFYNSQPPLSHLLVAHRQSSHQDSQFLTPSTTASGDGSSSGAAAPSSPYGVHPAPSTTSLVSGRAGPAAATTGEQSAPSSGQLNSRSSGVEVPAVQTAADEPVAGLQTAAASVEQAQPAPLSRAEPSNGPVQAKRQADDSAPSGSSAPAAAVATKPNESRRETFAESGHATDWSADNELVQSAPSPLGKILETVVRDLSAPASLPNQTAAASAKQPAASHGSSPAPTTAAPAGDELAAGDRRPVSSTTKQPPTTKPSEQQQQVLRPLRQADQRANKNPLKALEQQIINQHASASQSNVHRYEATTTMAPSAGGTQQFSLLPTRYRDNKLLNSFLSVISEHNSATSGNGDDSSSSSSSSSVSNNVHERQQAQKPSGGMLSSLAENFKSGISSRSSIVKAAMGDNKLARSKYNSSSTN